jgi:hypothetical protein
MHPTTLQYLAAARIVDFGDARSHHPKKRRFRVRRSPDA